MNVVLCEKIFGVLLFDKRRIVTREKSTGLNPLSRQRLFNATAGLLLSCMSEKIR